MSLGGAIASMFVEIGVKTDARAFDSLKLKIAAVSTALVALGKSLANEGGKLDRLKTITGIKKETIDSVRQLGIEAGISEREVDGLMETFAEMKHKATSYLHEQNIGLMGSGFQIGRGTKVTQILSHVLSVIAKIREEYGKLPEIGEQKAFEFLTVPMGLSSEQAYALMNMQERLAKLGGEMPKPRITEDMAEGWQDLNVQVSIFMGHLNSIKQKIVSVAGVTRVLEVANLWLREFNDLLVKIHKSPVADTIFKILSALLAIGVIVKAIAGISALLGLGKVILVAWRGVILIKTALLIIVGLFTTIAGLGIGATVLGIGKAIMGIMLLVVKFFPIALAISGALITVNFLLKKIFGFSLGTLLLASVKKLVDILPDWLKTPFKALFNWLDSTFGTNIMGWWRKEVVGAEKAVDAGVLRVENKIKELIMSVVAFAINQWLRFFDFISNKVEGVKDKLKDWGLLKDDRTKGTSKAPVSSEPPDPKVAKAVASVMGSASSGFIGAVLGWNKEKDSWKYSFMSQLMKDYYSRRSATIQSNDNSTNTYNVTVASKEEAVEVVEAVRASNSSPAKKVTGQEAFIGKYGEQLDEALISAPWTALNN